jgi:hypothetical protein
MHAAIPIMSLVGQLLTEHSENSNRKREGVKFVGMLAKQKHQLPQVATAGWIETGLLQRTDPIPPGRYWIDVFAPKQAIFDAWLKSAGAMVEVRKTESFEPQDSYPSRNWYLFLVNKPVAWGYLENGTYVDLASNLGWPTVADRNVQSSDDTVQKPKVKEGLPGIWESLGFDESTSATTKVLIVAGIVVIVGIGVGYAVRSFR